MRRSVKITAQALSYLLAHTPEKHLDEVSLLKLLFFAERALIRKNGYSLSGDKYVALPKGPVSSIAKGLLNEDSRCLHADEIEYAKDYILVKKRNGRRRNYKTLFKTKQNLSYPSLSENDKEKLKESLSLFTQLNGDGYRLVEYSHFFPEWSNHQDLLKTKKSVPMNMLDCFLSPTLVIEPSDVPQEQLEYNKSIYMGTN